MIHKRTNRRKTLKGGRRTRRNSRKRLAKKTRRGLRSKKRKRRRKSRKSRRRRGGACWGDKLCNLKASIDKLRVDKLGRLPLFAWWDGNMKQLNALEPENDPKLYAHLANVMITKSGIDPNEVDDHRWNVWQSVRIPKSIATATPKITPQMKGSGFIRNLARAYSEAWAEKTGNPPEKFFGKNKDQQDFPDPDAFIYDQLER